MVFKEYDGAAVPTTPVSIEVLVVKPFDGTAVPVRSPSYIVRDRAATTAPATHAGFVVSVATKPDANRPPAFAYVSS